MNIIQDKINKGILKFLEKNEAMVVDEDPFPPVASVNIGATDLRAVLNEKNDEKFSPNAMIRKVWIPKNYLVHKDELVVKGKISIVREKEKNERYPYHSKWEIKEEKPFKEKNVPLKERHTFLKGKGRNTIRRKIPPRFMLSSWQHHQRLVTLRKWCQKLVTLFASTRVVQVIQWTKTSIYRSHRVGVVLMRIE